MAVGAGPGCPPPAVIGRCHRCRAPHDDYATAHARCAVCRMRCLICEACAGDTGDLLCELCSAPRGPDPGAATGLAEAQST